MASQTRELRISTSDANRNGRPDEVSLEFYEDGRIINALIAIDKDEDGNIDSVIGSVDADGDGDLDKDDRRLMVEIAERFLRLKW